MVCRQNTLLGLIAGLAVSLLAAGCASDREDPYRGRSLALIIVDEQARQSSESVETNFSRTVERDAKDFAKIGAAAGFLTGCIGGLVVIFPHGGAMAGETCVAFGLAGGAVGYVAGSAFGAAIGTVEGSLTALKNGLTDLDNAMLIAALTESDPSAKLAAALKQAIPQGAVASLTRLEDAQPAEEYGHLSEQGYPFVIVLRITNYYFIDSVISTGIRIYLAVEGEVIDVAANSRRLAGDWTYTGDSADPAKLTENDRAILKARMKKALAGISSEIARDIFAAK